MYVYYVENLKLVPKGKEMEYEENLKLVRLINLSSNNLSGSIPVEISDLSELRFFEFVSKSFDGKDTRKNWEYERVRVN